jgi:hypothetical protein
MTKVDQAMVHRTLNTSTSSAGLEQNERLQTGGRKKIPQDIKKSLKGRKIKTKTKLKYCRTEYQLQTSTRVYRWNLAKFCQRTKKQLCRNHKQGEGIFQNLSVPKSSQRTTRQGRGE